METVESLSTMSRAIREAENYHRWLVERFAEHVPRGSTLLEVGSGHGRYSRWFAPRVRQLLVSDIDPVAVDRLRQELSDLDNARFLVMDGVDPDRLGQPVDVVALINVLEHIKDDLEVLQDCREALVSGGRVLLLVPAFAILFSRMDREAGHHRRYSKRGLEQLIARAGLRVEAMNHFNAVGFFGWLANRLLRSGLNSGTTNAQIQLYDRLIPVLKHVDRLLPMVGQSLVAVARKD